METQTWWRSSKPSTGGTVRKNGATAKGRYRLIAIEPSILSADFARLGEQAKEAEDAKVEGIQIDVMDGHFVPNITFGPGIVKALRGRVGLFLDVHLMISNPEKFLDEFARAGSDRIIVHQEACSNLHSTLQAIKDLKIEAGVAINPGTAVTAVEEVLDLANCIQVMTVNPGFAGQRFIESQVAKIQRLRRLLDDRHLETSLAVDGGIDQRTAPLAVESGATVLIAGSSVYNRTGTVAQNLAALRNSILRVRAGRLASPTTL